MLSVSTIARVVMNASRASATSTPYDTGLLLVKDSNYAASKRLKAYTSAADAAAGLVADGFSSSTEAYKATQKYFGASPSPSKLLVSCYPSSESLIQALDAVLDVTSDFYGIAVADTITDENMILFETHVSGLEKPAMIFITLIGTPANVVAADSLLDKLNRKSSRRVIATYGVAISDASAVMGTAMGLQLSHAASAFALAYKTVNGITPSSLTESQVDAIEDLGGNVYITRGYTHHLLEKGSTPSGFRYDEIMYMDMIGEDLQNAAVSLLADNPDKLPQTDDASAQFMNVFSSILMGYTNRGVLATATWRGSAVGSLQAGDYLENGFMLWAESYDNQSEADRAAHKAMPIQAALTMAGSLESIVITVNVRV